MDLQIGSVVYVVTDSGFLVRLDRIENLVIESNAVRATVGGSQVDLTDSGTLEEAEEALADIVAAQEQYAPVIRLGTRHAYDDDGNRIYTGYHKLINPDVDDENWAIHKYTWVNGLLRGEQGPIVGAWSNRANLGWG